MMTIKQIELTVGEIIKGYVNNDEQGVRGRTVAENCQMLCRECNRRKGAK